jgi:hypothetical protein
MTDEILEPKPNKTAIVEMSMRISKASYNKSETEPMRWTAIDSDTDDDLYEEAMSIELYRDFVDRIEKRIPVPESFAEAICEYDWCGGMPYLSIAHYKAGTGLSNVPGEVESVFIDGTRLKSKGTLRDDEMGRRVFKALREDLYMKEKSADHKPVRISIGFLDLEHKHRAQAGGQEFTFTRSEPGQMCPLCMQGIGGKIYMKGQLIHLAMTRVPVNPRTEMVAERSMDEITTKKQDAASIIGEDLAEGLEEKSIASDILVVRSEGGDMPTPEPSELAACYNPNTGGWNDECIRTIMDKYLPDIRNSIGVPIVKSESLPKQVLDVMVAHLYKSNGHDVPVVEASMEAKETVEKMQAGGKTVPEKKFEYEGISGDVEGNKVSSPIPAKAEVEEEKEEEKVEMKSTLDTSFETLKALVAKAQSGELDADAINTVFQSMGAEVEKAVKPAAKPASADDIASVVRSVLEEALTPIRTDIAILKAQKAPAASGNGDIVKSKALNFGAQKPEDVIKRGLAPGQETGRKLSQIEQLARKSTGL